MTTTEETSAQPVQSTPAPSTELRTDKRTIWALVALIGPTALWIVTFVLMAATNIAFSSLDVSTNMAGSLYPAQAALNILAFLIGVVAFLTWLPGIIIGIVLLVTRK